MKKFTFLFILIAVLSVSAQETKMGPILNDFGKVYQIDSPALVLAKNTKYKVIFDVYTDRSKGKKINPLLNTVARYLNMHAQKGIALENMKTVVVLHGSATQNVLNDAAYQKKFNRKNPNTALIAALKEAKVALFVCGQSFIAHTHSLSEKSTDVKLALSALTVLVNYQHKGYQLINFN